MKYRTHVSDIGWQDFVESPRQAGTTEQQKQLEAIEIELADIPNLGISYSTHLSNVGWTAPVISSQVSGTVGEGRAIEAFQAQLYGDEAQNYDIWYSLYVRGYGWLQWSKNGQPCGTEGGGIPAEALRMLLTRKDSAVLEVTTTWSYLKIERPPEPAPAPQPQVDHADAANRVLAVAQGEVGYLCNPDEGESSKYGEYFGMVGSQYCAQFVTWCGIMAGFPDAYPSLAYVPDIEYWYLNHDSAYWYYRDQTTPQRGDQVLFDYNRNDSPDHTGLVLDFDGRYLTTIEGNTRSPRGVYVKEYDMGGDDRNDIYGFGRPSY